MPIALSVARHAREHPERIAVAIGGARLSYGALARRAAQLAGGFRATPRNLERTLPGLPREGRLIALALPNRVELVELFAAASASPHACAMLDPLWPEALMRDVLARLAPDLLFAPQGSPAQRIAREQGARVVVLDDPGAEGYDAWLAAQAPGCVQRDGADDETFLVCFTSGTTSLPKAIVRCRRSWRASLEAGREVFALGPASHTLAPGPLAHGLTHYPLFECLREGATFHGQAKFDAGAALALLSKGEIARIGVAPTMLEGICRAAEAGGVAVEEIRSIVSAGAKLHEGLRERARRVFPRARIHEYYGASELGFVTVAVDDGRRRDPGLGHPFPGVSLSLRDDAGAPVPAGEPGIVHVRGPLVCDGYLWGGDGVGFRVRDGWATVGDIGTLDESGALRLLGREGGMIITGGHNVFPAEIEALLEASPGIARAAVLGEADPYLGARLVAIVSGEGGLDLAAIRDYCAARTTRAKLPRAFFALREWPLTPSGKIARKTLETWLRDRDARLEPLA